jgi:hypothetical protein
MMKTDEYLHELLQEQRKTNKLLESMVLTMDFIASNVAKNTSCDDAILDLLANRLAGKGPSYTK